MVRKQGIHLIAHYLRMDYQDIKEYEYQSGRYSQKVFAIDNKYYCPYKQKPSDGFQKNRWKRVDNIPFPYSDSVLWVYEGEEEG
ncbi:TPA: hypothetical protein ACPVZG_000494 [Vibrio parahaemolyticus]